MFEGYQQCVISSTSFHAETTARGVVKRSPKALSKETGKSIIHYPCDLCALTSRPIQCPVVLLFYMCKSFTFCQNRSFDNKTSPHHRGHGETQSRRRQSLVLPARARPATDSDKDDNSAVTV